MKLLLILLLSFSTQAIEKDKKMHLGGSVFISSFSTLLFKDEYIGFGICFTAGVGKELLDESLYGGFDTKDLGYGALGCGIGSYLSYELLGDNVKFNQYSSGNDTITSLQYEYKF